MPPERANGVEGGFSKWLYCMDACHLLAHGCTLLIKYLIQFCSIHFDFLVCVISDGSQGCLYISGVPSI